MVEESNIIEVKSAKQLPYIEALEMLQKSDKPLSIIQLSNELGFSRNMQISLRRIILRAEKENKIVNVGCYDSKGSRWAVIDPNSDKEERLAVVAAYAAQASLLNSSSITLPIDKLVAAINNLLKEIQFNSNAEEAIDNEHQ